MNLRSVNENGLTTPAKLSEAIKDPATKLVAIKTRRCGFSVVFLIKILITILPSLFHHNQIAL